MLNGGSPIVGAGNDRLFAVHSPVFLIFVKIFPYEGEHNG